MPRGRPRKQDDGPAIGHNSAAAAGVLVAAHLRAFVERIERLELEKAGIASDIRDIYAEAKDSGFDTKALRAIIRLRRLDADERAEQQAIIDTYLHALGMLADLPLGKAAMERDLGMTPDPQVDLEEAIAARPA